MASSLMERLILDAGQTPTRRNGRFGLLPASPAQATTVEVA
jgi:hypothetical protein